MKRTKNDDNFAYYTVSEYAKKIKRTVPRVYQLIASKDLRAIKIGNTVLIPKVQ